MTNLRGNLIDKGGIGLQLGDQLLPNSATVISPQIHHANRWEGNFQGVGAAFYAGGSNNIVRSRFEVKSSGQNGNPVFLPNTLVVPQAPWFNDNPNSATPNYNCPSGTPPIPGMDIVVSDITGGYYEPTSDYQATKWIAAYRTHRAEHGGKISQVDYSNWSNWTTTTGAIAAFNYLDVEEQLAAQPAAYSAPATSTAPFEEWPDSIQAYANEYAQLTDERYRDTLADVATIDAQRYQLSWKIDSLQQLLSTESTNYGNHAIPELQNAASTSNGLLDTALYQTNSKVVTSSLTDWFTGVPGGLEQHKTAIVQIANQCPLDGGEAVFQARALAFQLGDEGPYDDITICKVASKKRGDELLQDSTPQALIYPNPTNDRFSFSSPEVEVTEVQLLNTLGRSVLTELLGKDGRVSGSVNVSDIPAGVYTVQLHHVDSQISTQFIIIR